MLRVVLSSYAITIPLISHSHGLYMSLVNTMQADELRAEASVQLTVANSTFHTDFRFDVIIVVVPVHF